MRGPTEVVVETRAAHPARAPATWRRTGARTRPRTWCRSWSTAQPNPEGAASTPGPAGRSGPRGRPRSRFATPRRVEVIDELAERDLLPALYFVFSRAGCDEAATSCLHAGVRAHHARRAGPHPGHRSTSTLDGLGPDDLAVLGYDRFAAALEAGIASHHAGMVPPFKEAVERCFVQGLVKVVFATETLALGINMPARTVVIEKLSKFTGERHEFLTAGRVHPAHRAGRAPGHRRRGPRRGAVVARSSASRRWPPWPSSRTFLLRSAFRPTYNMAANLVAPLRRGRGLPAAQPQLRPVPGRPIGGAARAPAGRAPGQTSSACREDAGPSTPTELARLPVRCAAPPGRPAPPTQAAQRAVETAVARLVPGTDHPSTAARRWSCCRWPSGAPAPCVRVVTPEAPGPHRAARRLPRPAGPAWDPSSCPSRSGPITTGFQQEVVRRLTRARVNLQRTGGGQPRGGREAAGWRQPAARSRIPGPAAALARPRWQAVEAHPLHQHPDRDAAAAPGLNAWPRLETEVAELTGRIDGTADTVARRFGRLLELHAPLGVRRRLAAHRTGRAPWPAATTSAICWWSRPWPGGLLDGLDAPTVAALVSCFTYEHRSRTAAAAGVDALGGGPGPPSGDRAARRSAAQRRRSGRACCSPGPPTPPSPRSPTPGHRAATSTPCSATRSCRVATSCATSSSSSTCSVSSARSHPTPATAAAARRAADALFRGVVAASAGLDEPLGGAAVSPGAVGDHPRGDAVRAPTVRCGPDAPVVHRATRAGGVRRGRPARRPRPRRGRPARR